MQDQLYLSWQLDPILIGSLVAAAVAYFAAVGPLRSRLAPGTRFPFGRASLFVLALVITYLTEGSPLHDLSERYLFSAHMVQHLLINYICAPLLIWGLPVWLLRHVMLSERMLPFTKLITNPVFAALSFALFLSLWHVPAIYDAGLRNSSIHHTQHVLFMLISFVGWWPIMNPLKELPRLGHGAQIVYLFIISNVLQLPLFAIVTFSSEPFYASYINAPRVAAMEPLVNGVFTAQMDQQLAGVIMKVLAFVFYAIPIAFIFTRWFKVSRNPTYVVKDAVVTDGKADSGNTSEPEGLPQA